MDEESTGRVAREINRDRVFCVLPWVHLHVRPDGGAWPCCVWAGPVLGSLRASSVAELWNSPGLRGLRTAMLNGESSAGCAHCYEADRFGMTSMRREKNADFTRHVNRAQATAADGSAPLLTIPYVDVRLSNVCNFRCRTCGPEQSSAWAEDARALGQPAAEGSGLLKTYRDWQTLSRELEVLLTKGLEEILFAGGESLVMEEHYRILDFLTRRRLFGVRLRYVTNLSTLSFGGRDLLELWKPFERLEITASLDGSGRRGEFLRRGQSWERTVGIRKELLKRRPDLSFSVSAVLSAVNALHLPDFHREWVEKGYVDADNFRPNVLLSPKYYRTQVLPPAFKEKVAERYRRHCESLGDGESARAYRSARDFMLGQDLSALLPRLREKTLRLDQLRAERCSEVFPELASLFS